MRRLALIFIFCLAACSGQRDTAQKLMANIHGAVVSASSEAAKYVPSRLADVQTQLIELQEQYDEKEYANVVSRAPALLEAAQALATEAAAKKDEVLKGLNDDWTALAASVPDEMTALQKRIESLSQHKTKPQTQIDIEAARQTMGSAQSLWSKAQGAFAAGNLEEAVATAKDVKDKLGGAEKSVGLTPPG
jgi:hypothetical protein